MGSKRLNRSARATNSGGKADLATIQLETTATAPINPPTTPESICGRKAAMKLLPLARASHAGADRLTLSANKTPTKAAAATRIVGWIRPTSLIAHGDIGSGPFATG